ncbi:uncharacterized protein LOC124295461 [Neodiprion lecontei]|uniref:Uncharacterized protein LOC124295461 n=1 Tax=Neodiprion lecontei TaxID=441921 RepID=A0ABM3GMJ4_NEOLC|nr:uncharacterized protein LOC124295461 [Neodiprion lecontei]
MKGEGKEMDPATRESRNGDIWAALQEVVRDNPRFWLYFSSVMIQVREAVLERAAAGSAREFFPGYPKYRDVASQTETISVRDVGTQTEIADENCQDDNKIPAIWCNLTELTESPLSPNDVRMDDKMEAQESNKMASGLAEDDEMASREENKMAAQRNEQTASEAESGTAENEIAAAPSENNDKEGAKQASGEAAVKIMPLMEVKTSGSISKEKNKTHPRPKYHQLICIRCGKHGYETDKCPNCSTNSFNEHQKPSAPQRRRSRNRHRMRDPYQNSFDYSRYMHY